MTTTPDAGPALTPAGIAQRIADDLSPTMRRGLWAFHRLAGLSAPPSVTRPTRRALASRGLLSGTRLTLTGQDVIAVMANETLDAIGGPTRTAGEA